jgi:hypothetical protein
LTADGESGKAGGNETIRVDDDGRLRIKTPAALADQFGSHVVIEVPIRFSHRGQGAIFSPCRWRRTAR